MSNSHLANNYISSFKTSTGAYHLYHDNIVLFGSHELSSVIFPGLLHELRSKCKYPEMFSDVVSTPSRYELPSYLDADKLTEEIRSTVASALVFIHTWIGEYSSQDSAMSDVCKGLLEENHPSYGCFFERMLSFIISIEINGDVKDLAHNLKISVKKISQYLGPYHGAMNETIFKTYHILVVIVMLLYLNRYF